jgi:hypothetical protein
MVLCAIVRLKKDPSWVSAILAFADKTIVAEDLPDNFKRLDRMQHVGRRLADFSGSGTRQFDQQSTGTF